MKMRKSLSIVCLLTGLSMVTGNLTARAEETSMEILTEYQYENISALDGNGEFFSAEQDNYGNSTGVIDRRGNLIIDMVYQYISYTGEYFKASNDSQCALYDTTGSLLWSMDDHKFEAAGDWMAQDTEDTLPIVVYEGEYIPITSTDGIGMRTYKLADANGMFIAEGYSDMIKIGNVCYAYKDRRCYVLNEKGEVVKQIEADQLMLYDSCFIGGTYVNGGIQYTLYDSNLAQIYDSPFQKYLYMGDSFVIKTDGNMKIIDPSGKILKELNAYSNINFPQDYYLNNFESRIQDYRGRPAVPVCFVEKGENDWYYGMVDSHGNEVLPCVFDSIEFAYASQMAVNKEIDFNYTTTNNKFYIIAEYDASTYLFNLDGELLYERTKDDEGDFIYENDILYQAIYPNYIPLVYNLETKLDLVLEGIYPLSQDAFWGEKDGYYILYSRDGKILSDAYEYLVYAGEDFSIVKNNGLFGAVDSKGKEVLPCAYQDINYNWEWASTNTDGIPLTNTYYFFEGRAPTYLLAKTEDGIMDIYTYSGTLAGQLETKEAMHLLGEYFIVQGENEKYALARVPLSGNSSSTVLWPILIGTFLLVACAGIFLFLYIRRKIAAAEKTISVLSMEQPEESIQDENAAAGKISWEEIVEGINTLYRQVENNALTKEDFQQQKKEILRKL